MYQKMYGGHWDLDWIDWCFAHYNNYEQRKSFDLATGFIGTI